jgi:hypothetical protein
MPDSLRASRRAAASRGIRGLAVPAHLEPQRRLGVQAEQHPALGRVDHQRTRRQVVGPPGAPHSVAALGQGPEVGLPKLLLGSVGRRPGAEDSSGVGVQGPAHAVGRSSPSVGSA